MQMLDQGLFVRHLQMKQLTAREYLTTCKTLKDIHSGAATAGEHMLHHKCRAACIRVISTSMMPLAAETVQC